MRCDNCGADFDQTEPRCPYCGTLNPLGAEQKYMEKLEDIREDTEDLMDIPEEEYVKELKHHGHLALKISLSVAAICLVLGVILWASHYYHDRMDRQTLWQTIEFQDTYYPKLNELYAAGDDDAVVDYMYTLFPLDETGAIYDWEHYSYYWCYELYCEIMNIKKEVEVNGWDESSISSAFLDSLVLVFEDYSDPSSVTDSENAKVEAFRKEVLTFCQDYLHLSESQLRQAYESCLGEYDFLDYTLCDEYSKTLLESLT